MAVSDLAKEIAPFVPGDAVELAPQHGDAGLGIDAGRADILMAEEFLDVGDIHAVRQQPRCHGMAQQMRIEALPDPGLAGDVAHHLPDALAGVDPAAGFALFAADEERSSPALADMQGEEPREFCSDRHLAPLAALAALNDDDALGD